MTKAWAERCLDEFFAQGDQAGLQQTFFCLTCSNGPALHKRNKAHLYFDPGKSSRPPSAVPERSREVLLSSFTQSICEVLAQWMWLHHHVKQLKPAGCLFK